jgi:hypothetical protein
MLTKCFEPYKSARISIIHSPQGMHLDVPSTAPTHPLTQIHPIDPYTAMATRLATISGAEHDVTRLLANTRFAAILRQPFEARTDVYCSLHTWKSSYSDGNSDHSCTSRMAGYPTWMGHVFGSVAGCVSAFEKQEMLHPGDAGLPKALRTSTPVLMNLFLDDEYNAGNDNIQTRVYSGCYHAPMKYEWCDQGERMLDAAMESLEQLFLVGVYERYVNTAQLFSHAFHVDYSVALDTYVRQEVSPCVIAVTGGASYSPSLKRRVEDMDRLDYRLHRFVNALMDSRLASLSGLR